MVHAAPTVSDDDVAGCWARRSPTLPPDLVARFVIRAGTTWGGPDDLRRVVPRALVLSADHALPVDRTVLWDKLRWAGWPAWPDREVEAGGRFLRAEWGRLVRSEPRPAHAVHRWLVPTSGATHDLSPFLDDWHEALGPLTPPAHHQAAVGHLVALLLDSPLRPDLPDTVADVIPARTPPPSSSPSGSPDRRSPTSCSAPHRPGRHPPEPPVLPGARAPRPLHRRRRPPRRPTHRTDP